jgi:hypothetical protein
MAEKKKTGLASYLEAMRNFADEYGLYQTPHALTPLVGAFTPPSGRSFADEPPPPSRPTKVHAGTLMMGQSPEEVQRWQEGNSPFMGKPSAEGAPVIRSIPGRSGNIASDAFRFKEGRTLPVLDTVLVGSDIAGLAGLAGRGLRRGAQAAYPALNPEMNMSRREFMGNTGKVAGGLAAASVLPLAVRGTEHAAPVVERAAGHAAAAAARTATHAEYQAAKELARLNAIRAMDLVGLPRDSLEASRAYKLALEDEMARIKNNPHFKDFESIDDIRAREAQELDELERNYDGSRDRQNPNDGADYGEDWENYMYRRQEIEDKYYDITAAYDKKHGYIDNNEVYTRMTEDPNFKYVDPYSHRELAWVKWDKDKHQWVKTEFNPNQYVGTNGQTRGFINPETGRAYANRVNPSEHPDPSAEYWKKYLRDREIPHAKGGSVTMPDNYRAGGRVRVI